MSERKRLVAPRVPATPSEKLAAIQVARTQSSPFARAAPADPDTSVRATCDVCFSTFIAAAGRTAEQNLSVHHEDKHGARAEDSEQASRRRRDRRAK
jgi:hypothetical protein